MMSVNWKGVKGMTEYQIITVMVSNFQFIVNAEVSDSEISTK